MDLRLRQECLRRIDWIDFSRTSPHLHRTAVERACATL
jgi:hypothetical protein